MKRVLIITYYWPPSGGSGVQRWLKFVKYLPQYGWKPIIIVPDGATYPIIDTTLIHNIPEEAEVIRLKIWEPYDLFKKITGRKKSEVVNTAYLYDDNNRSIIEKISLWIRGNILIPDPRKFWVKPTIRNLRGQIDRINPEVIITTGPPHSIHLIGLGLKKCYANIKWIADFRDPWSEFDLLDNFYPSKFAIRKQLRLEKFVLGSADMVLSVSPTWVSELRKKTSTNVQFLANGFDSDDFTTLEKKSQDNFVITHAGVINNFRNPKYFWSVLEELCNENAKFYANLKVQMVGVTGNGLKKTLYKYPIVSKKTSVQGYVSHKEVIELYDQSSCLLLLLNNTKNSQGHIPAKFFEYIAAKKLILAIGPIHSDVGKIIKKYEIGETCEFNDRKMIKNAIVDLYNRWESKHELGFQKQNDFSRKELTKKLIRIMESF